MPFTIITFMGPEGEQKIPKAIGDDFTGHLIWLTIFSFFFLFPLSLPRQLGKLRFTSLMSFCMSIFIVLSIFTLCFRKTAATAKTPGSSEHWSFHERWYALNHDIGITYLTIFNSVPLMIFMYMY